MSLNTSICRRYKAVNFSFTELIMYQIICDISSGINSKNKKNTSASLSIVFFNHFRVLRLWKKSMK